MNKYKKLGQNTVLFLVGNFAQKILGFVFVPIYTAVLSTEQYGAADLIVTIISMLWPFYTIVINEACFRFLLDKNIDRNQIVTSCLLINLLGIVLFLLCSPVFLLCTTLDNYYGLFVIYFIIYTFDSFLIYTIRGLEKISEMVIGGITNTIVTASCNLLFLFVFKWGIYGYLLGFICGMLTADIWYITKTNIFKYFVKTSILNKDLIKSMARYSLPMVPNSISWWISNSSDRILVTYFCGIAMNGIYSVAYKIPSLLSVISSVFVNAWQISSVDDFGTEENRIFFSRIYRKYVTVNVIGTSCLICFVQVISHILFSKDFFEAYQIAPYLLLGAVYKALSAFLGSIYTAAKKTKMLFFSTMSGAFLNIVLNIILLKKIGVLGAAIATLVSYFIVWLVRIIDTRKILKLEIDIRKEVFVYIILLLQILIWTFQIPYSYLFEVLLVGIVFFIEKSEWLPILKVTVKKVNGR